MSDDLLLRRKWTLRAHGRQVVLVKRPNERAAHVLMKALIWALYLPSYPELTIEVAVSDRYKPDVVALGAAGGQPRFWGEAGQVGDDKIRALARRYRHTHLAIGKWATRLAPLAEQVRAAVAGQGRGAPFDLICFPSDSAERFVDATGAIQIAHDDVEWLRIEG
jgi:hypothetical protein